MEGCGDMLPASQLVLLHCSVQTFSFTDQLGSTASVPFPTAAFRSTCLNGGQFIPPRMDG